MMADRMQQWLERAARELGVRVVVGFVARLADGRSVSTRALFPDLGGSSGTLVFALQDDFAAELRPILVEHGYALSTFSEPYPDEEFDLESYAAMFREWGWTGSLGEKPRFMR